ncbi:DUF3042 domain-containing protein, partial [Veillonellaceae bacterium M2-4]|nr:DUF3042 domain-containing protein [Veillonellaceae bacterium M2-4]
MAKKFGAGFVTGMITTLGTID